MKKLWATLVLILSMAVLLTSCSSGSDPLPVNRSTVTTTAVTNIAATTATSGGNVTSDGLLGVTARGVCWSRTANPTINDSKTSNGTGKGAFVSAITGLTPNTLYHVRAYATSILGTAYGEDRTFTTTQEGFTFTAVQYKIVQPDGTTIILRSRGMGSDPNKAYFDIFIEDGKGGVEAFLANPVWYHFDAITAENAINHVIADSEVRGLLASVNNSYYLDINGGSDMGGITHQINTGSYALDMTKAITAFDFGFLAYGIVTEETHTIAVTVPFGTNVTALAPAITHTGASINPASGVANNFTTPKTYTVTAADGSTQAYTVTVTIAPASSAKAITAFTFPTSTATYINEADHTISVRVPSGTDVTALVPTITHNGVSINPATSVANNFTNPKTYTVTAADTTTQAYMVYVYSSGATVIHVDTLRGGNIDSGLRTDWDGIYENVKGALFFNGSIFVTNDTAAHMYFTDLRTGLRLLDYIVTTIGSTAGSQDVQPGYTLTRSTYTYTAAKDPGGPWIKDLGSSYPVSVYLMFMDGGGVLRQMRFLPAVSVE